MKTKYLGGLIALASPGGQSGTGFLIADAYSSDTTLADTTINGWLNGLYAAGGASHFAVHHNFIGNYGFFPVGSKTNGTAITVAAGAGDDIEIDDNHLVGNTTAPLVFAAAGTNNRVHDNPGYNPVGPSAITPGASPWTFTAGPTETDLYLNGGTVSSVALGGVTLCSAAPCRVTLSPYQAAVVTYSTAPTAAKSIH